MLTVETSAGRVVWEEGRAPRIVLFEGNEKSPRVPAALATDEIPGSRIQAAPARRRILLREPPAHETTKRAAQMADGAAEVVAVLGPPSAVGRQEAALASLRDLERHLRGARPDLVVAYELDIALAADGAEFLDFVLPRLARIAVTITDPGRSESESHALAERGASISDQGITVRPTLWLTRHNASRWAEWAATWWGVSRGAGFRLGRPAAIQSDYRGAVETLPVPEAVGDFLSTMYRSGTFDLWSVAPFSTLLETVFLGSAGVPRCGSDWLLCIDASGAVGSCQHGIADCPGAAGETCDCASGPFCDAVCAPCPGLRSLANTPDWQRWERLFCPAVNALMPKIFEDLATAARYQQALVSRPEDERFRVAAHAGRLKIWRESVPVGAVGPEG